MLKKLTTGRCTKRERLVEERLAYGACNAMCPEDCVNPYAPPYAETYIAIRAIFS